MASSRKQTITLALVGKVGYGKSACGNSILGRNTFITSDNYEPCSLITNVGWAERETVKVKVVDTPGLMDPDENRELENIAIQIPEVMSVCPKGIHALCLVFKYGCRFTAEDKNSVKKIKDIFGANFIRRHGIIIMTAGDNFDINREDNEGKAATFEQWCERQTGEFQEIFKECNNRIVLFYNKGSGYKTERERAVGLLLNMAEQIGRNGLYTLEKFELCFRIREQEIIKLKLPELSLPIRKKLYKIEIIISELPINMNMHAKEKYVNSMKQSILALIKTINLIKDTEVKSKLCEKLELLHVKVMRINLDEPLQDQLKPILKIVKDLKNPKIPSKTIATLVAVGIAISGVMTGGAGLVIGMAALTITGGVATAAGITGSIGFLIDTIVSMIESKPKSIAKAGHND